jgi:cAMP-binding proteins - catabolite gene activator and regulatory subunit of cAMP-dependent protein kinases
MGISQEQLQIFSQPQFLNSPWLSRESLDWSFLKKFGSPQNYKKGGILKNGSPEPARAIGYIDKGRVRTSVLNEHGEEKIILVVDEGNLLDVVSAIDNIPSYLIITAVTDCKVYWIPKSTFVQLADTRPEFTRRLLEDMTYKTRVLITHIEDMSFMSSSARIAKCLYRLAKDYGVPQDGGIRLTIKFTHYEMAIFAGSCRVTATNILESMERAGILSKDNGYFVIHNLPKLKEWIST